MFAAIIQRADGGQGQSRKLPIEAHITEVDGAHYPVRLASVPRSGELIDLYSYRDDVRKRYEVVQVIHQLHETTDAAPEGHQLVTVLVRPSRSHFFGNIG